MDHAERDMEQPPTPNAVMSAVVPASFPSQPVQQENMAREGGIEELITVEDEVTRGTFSGGTSATALPATKTAADGTIRARLAPRQQRKPTTASSAGALCFGGQSAPTAGSGCSAVEGIAVGRTFPFMGDADSTWANVEETIRSEVGGPYPLRRNNRQKLFRCRDEHERSMPNRWSTVRMECAQAGTPVKSPLAEDVRKRRSTSSKKINCNWKVLCQWPQRTHGPYISQVHLSHDTPLQEGGQHGKEHPPPRAFDNELSKDDIQKQEDKIKKLVEVGVGTTELHRFLQRDGKRLGEQGKQKVRNIRRKHQLETAATGSTSPTPPGALTAAAAAAIAQQSRAQQQQTGGTPPLPPPPPPPQAPAPPTPPDNRQVPGSAAPQAIQASSPSAFVLGSSNGGHAGTGSTTNGAASNGAQIPNGGGGGVGASSNGAPSSLDAVKFADCIAFGKELASIASEISSCEAMDRVIAHARVAADNAIRVELQCQGRRAGAS
ncbi:unnamed protein product [Scytosiphon promiscuus]